MKHIPETEYIMALPRAERIDRLIKALRDGISWKGESVRFNMAEWMAYRDAKCGTAACVAGHASLLVCGREMDDEHCNELHLMQLTGATTEEAKAMSIPRHVSLVSVRPIHAIQMLETYRDTGKVKWPDEIIKWPGLLVKAKLFAKRVINYLS